jgi:hypothetical protein
MVARLIVILIQSNYNCQNGIELQLLILISICLFLVFNVVLVTVVVEVCLDTI